MSTGWPPEIQAAYAAGRPVWWDDDAGRWVTDVPVRPAYNAGVAPEPPVMAAPVVRHVERRDCPRGHSNAIDVAATDEFGHPDAHCIICGYRVPPPNLARVLADDEAAQAGKERRRRPMARGIRL